VTSPLVSIIVVNYKDYAYLNKCLISLNKTTYPNTEIVVVDNESNSNALDKLKDEFKNVRFFSLRENLQYAGGNNYGIINSKGEFIVLLNNDTTVEGAWLEPLVREALIEPRAFYQPKILSLDKSDTILSLGNTVHLLGIAFPIGIGKLISEISLPKHKVEVFYCSGACIFTSRETLDEFGSLDSNYWTYYEDVSLGWRGRLRGCPSYLVSDSTIYHKWGGSYGQQLSPQKLFLLERGRLSSILRNFSIRSLLLLFPAVLILELLLTIYLLRKGLATAKIRATIDVFRNLRIIIHERKKIQASRKKTDREISLYMSSTLQHPYIGKIPHTAERILIKVSETLMNIL
jgi:GT2 family glycosyltransferase